MLTRMLILWLLSEQPLHGYRIKRILGDDAMSFWFPVQDASIYSVLRSLLKNGYAKIAATEREGNRPERTRYGITKKGRGYLRTLLRKAWVSPPSPADSIHLALAARSELEEDEILDHLKERQVALESRMKELDILRRSAPAISIVDRQRALTEAELKWVKSMI